MYTLVDENMWQLLLAFDPSMLAECLKFNHSSSVKCSICMRQVAESGPSVDGLLQRIIWNVSL